MKAHIFYSGSKGNCTYISDGETSILIDAGGCLKRIRENLEEVSDRLDNIKGIFVTHEHTDHTKALFNIVKKYDTHIFTSLDTAKNICTPTNSVPVCDCKRLAERIMTVKPEKTYEIGTFTVKPFSTPHDVTSLGFIIHSKVSNKTLAYATDIGCITAEMAEHMAGIENVIIESNHDVHMLMNGSYPEYLKTRILSDRGHLSNVDCAAFLKFLMKMGTKSITLAHLSEENNTPVLARKTIEEVILDGVKLQVANPYKRIEMEIC